MIEIDKGLIKRFIDGNFGLAIAHENMPDTPAVGTPYAEIFVLQNDVTSLTLAHTNLTDGVFRVILHYPGESGAVAAKTMADTIFAQFKLGSKIEYSGVKILITGNKRQNGTVSDGWFEIVLTVAYRAFLRR